MEATFKLQASEFTQQIFEQIQEFIKKGAGEKGGEVVISFTPTKPKKNPLMSEKDFFLKIDKAIAAVEKGNGMVTFSAEEFEEFTKKAL